MLEHPSARPCVAPSNPNCRLSSCEFCSQFDSTAAIPAEEGGSVPATRSQTWTRSLCVSIKGHEKRWDFKLRRIDCKPVLRRPLENTLVFGNWR